MTQKSKQDLRIEKVPAGYANGISLQLAAKIDTANLSPIHTPIQEISLTEEEKQKIIIEAAKHYGNFLTALGCDWRNDPNSLETPIRVAKAYMEKWKGRYEGLGNITSFPSDGYTGVVQESGIPLVSMCSHHHETIYGTVSIAYIPSKDGQVIGLSKLNRVVEHFGRRGAIQEQLTVAIHDAIKKLCSGNQGVAVMINATHNCVRCRGVKHQGASMQTTMVSGCFMEEGSARAEFFKNIELADKLKS